MKILKIKGENLTTLESFELDFSSEEFQKGGGLFVITGPTGAGKSTLLDCICLALYGLTPRYNGKAGPSVGHPQMETQRLGINDPFNLMRNGATSAFAEVEFIGAQELRYRARWEIRRARGKLTGRIQEATWRIDQLDDAGEVVALLNGKGVKEVRARLVEAVGLTFEQFRRSVFLAQGDFDAFIKANSKERGELLERMTGTDIYRRLSIAAHARARDARQKAEEVERRARDLHLLSPAQEQELRATLEQRAREVGELDRQLEELRAEQESLNRISQQELRLGSATQDIDFHTQQLTQGGETWRRARRVIELEPLRALLGERRGHESALAARRQESQSLSAHLSQCTEALERAEVQRAEVAERVHALEARWGADEDTRTLVRAAEERSSLLQEQTREGERALSAQRGRAQRAQEALAQRGASLEQRRARLAERRARLAGAQSGALLVGQESTWQKCGRALAAALDAHQAELRGLTEVRAQEERDRAALKEREEAAGAAAAAAAAARLNLERLAPHDAAALAEAQQGAARLTERRAALRAAREQLEQWAADLEQREGLEEELAGAEEELAARRAAHLSDDREATKLEVRAEIVEEALSQARSANALEALRRDLKEGDPCPLCGALEHPRAGESPSQSLAALERDCAEVRAAAEKARARAHEAAREESGAQARLASTRATLSAASVRAAQRAERAAAAARDALSSWPPLPALGAAMASLREAPRGAEPPTSPNIDAAQRRHADLYALFCERLTPPSDRAGALQAGRDLGALSDALSALVEELEALAKDTLSAAQRRAELLGALTAAEQRAEVAQEKLRYERASLERAAAALEAVEARLTAQRRDVLEHREALRALLSLTPDRRAARALAEPLSAPIEESARAPLPAHIAALSGAEVLDLVNIWSEQASAWLRDEREARELETAVELEAQGLPALERAAQEEREGLAAEEERHEERRAAQEAAQETLERLAEERARLSRLQSELAAARADAEALREQRDQMSAEHAETLERARAANMDLAGLEAVSQNIRQRWEEQASILKASEEELDALSPAMTSAARAALSDEEQLRQSLEAARARASLLREEISQLTRQLKGEGPLEDRRGALQARRVERQEQHDVAVSERAALQGQLASNLANKSQHAQVEAERRRLGQELQRWERLNHLIGSATGNTFRDFAQSLTLELILEHANCFLKDLAPRYSLMRIPDQDLALQVVDHDYGDELRSMQSLSGGETFLVSLSLALGLSSTSAQDVQIQSLFIDEGFGTLDPASLDVAISVLENLQVEGRLIGMISHVEGLSERVGLEVRVEPQGSGRSVLRVRNHS